jgi:hypothetical protein
MYILYKTESIGLFHLSVSVSSLFGMLPKNTKNLVDRLSSRIAVVPPLRTTLVLVFLGDPKELQDVHYAGSGEVGKLIKIFPEHWAM